MHPGPKSKIKKLHTSDNFLTVQMLYVKNWVQYGQATSGTVFFYLKIVITIIRNWN